MECGTLSPRVDVLLATLGTWGPTAPPGILPEFPPSTFPSRKNPVRIFKVPASPGLGFRVLEAPTTP